MTGMLDHDYWEFTADVHTASVSVGTAVEFVKRTDGNSIPWVKPAVADNDVHDEDARTTYIGVALIAGNVGDRITVRCWAAGTMPALTLAPTVDIPAGSDLYWDGTQFVLVDPSYTEYTVDTVTDNGADEVYLKVTGETWTIDEFEGFEMVVTSGEHEDEHYRVTSNTADTITLFTGDIVDWTAPLTINIADSSDAGWSIRTAVNMSNITANALPQIAELLVLKGGRT